MIEQEFLVEYTGAVVRCVGELDMFNAPQVRDAGLAALATLNDDGSPLIFDLSDLTFCDSSGIAAFLVVMHKAEASGHAVVLHSPQGPVQTVLRISGVASSFTIEPPLLLET